MQSKREKFLKGLITEEEFRNEAISRTVNSLKERDYQFVQNLGSGSFGTVFYAINKQSQNMAVKIVLEEKVNRNELKIWPTLRNENILSLNEVQYIASGGSFAFFTPLISTSLDLVLEDSVLSVDKNGMHLAKSYLKDILAGVQHLHSRKLCHLDIKANNILISDSGKALLCDFSSLTMTEAGTDGYASPFLYRPPEAVISENDKKTVVNGFSYDIYTIGLLALEIFTNQAVLKACRSIKTGSTWDMEIYPKVFEVLKRKHFEKAVQKAFLESEVDKKLINISLNFVKSCLCLNPRLRPSLVDMQDHKVFGGSTLLQRSKNDVWERKATSKKLSFLISLFVAQASSLSLPPDSDKSTQTTSIQSIKEKDTKCGVEDGILIPDKIKNVTERASETNSSKKHMFRKWMADRKSDLYDRFNRIFTALRRPRS